MKILLAFVLAIVVSLLIIQCSPFRIKPKSGQQEDLSKMLPVDPEEEKEVTNNNTKKA